MGHMRHLIVAGAIFFDLAIIALVIFTRVVIVRLPTDAGSVVLLSRLPQLASVVGTLITALNGVAVFNIARDWGVRAATHEGFTLAGVEAVGEVANGGIPRRMSPLLGLAVLVLASKSFITSALVGALTPVTFLTDFEAPNLQFPEFSSASGTPDVECGYGETYGYGKNCPMNEAYGVIFDAGIQAFSGNIPTTFTRDGVTYPFEVSGISGSLSNVTRRTIDSLFPDQHRVITSKDQVRLCLPRMNVSTTCSPTIGRAGYSIKTTQVALGSLVFQPRYITVAQACIDGACTGDRNTAPDYGYGSVIVFGMRDSSNGGTSVIISSTDKYSVDYTSSTVECNTTAIEQQVAVQITSNSVLTVDAGRTCPSRPQPDPKWLTSLTYISQMALQKQQGQDGRLEAIKLVGQGTSTIQAFELAISRMVSVAATEMYAILDEATASAVKNGSLAAAPWTNGQTVAFRTPQSRLGAASAVYWGVAPAFMVLLLLAGWMRWSTHSSPSEFNPLHPISMAAAGLNSTETPAEIIAAGNVSAKELAEATKHLRFRYGEVAFGRLGLTTRDSYQAPPPSHGSMYGLDGLNKFTPPPAGPVQYHAVPYSAQSPY